MRNYSLDLLLDVDQWLNNAFLGSNWCDFGVVSQTLVICILIWTHREYNWDKFDLFQILLDLLSSWFRIDWIDKPGEVIRRVFFTACLRLLELLNIFVDATVGAFSLIDLVQVYILWARTFNSVLMCRLLTLASLLFFFQASHLLLGLDQRSHLFNNVTLNVFLGFLAGESGQRWGPCFRFLNQSTKMWSLHRLFLGNI